METEEQSSQDTINKFSKIDVLILFIIVIGMLIRIVGIGEMPNALNCDEASSGYEAHSILNYGIDRNGNKLPAFLVSWGRRTKCITFIFNDTIHKSVRVK